MKMQVAEGAARKTIKIQMYFLTPELTQGNGVAMNVLHRKIGSWLVVAYFHVWRFILFELPGS